MYWVRHFRPAFLSLQITFVTPVKLSKLQLPLAPKIYDGQYGAAHVGPAHHLRTGTGRKTRRTTRPYKHKNIKIRVSRTGPSKVAHAWAGSTIRNEVITVTLAIAAGNKIKTSWKRHFKNEQNRKIQSQQICAWYLQTATAMSRISNHRNIKMSTAQAQIAQEMSSKNSKNTYQQFSLRCRYNCLHCFHTQVTSICRETQLQHTNIIGGHGVPYVQTGATPPANNT